jgi:hypothetical protein
MKTFFKLSVAAFVAFPLFSEAGSPASISVSMRELIQKPKQFNGKRISVVAFYGWGGHARYLCEDAKAALNDRGEHKVFPKLDNARIAKKTLLKIPFNSFVRVVGTFQYKDTTPKEGHRVSDDPFVSGVTLVPEGFGWMGIFDKQITDITQFISVSPLKGR